MACAMLDLALTSAVALLVTIDPIGTGPVFAALTRGSDDAHRRRMAVKGVVIAAVILFVFAFVGDFLLRALGIGLPDRRWHSAAAARHRHGFRTTQRDTQHDWAGTGGGDP